MNAVILLSGGYDSATVLATLVDRLSTVSTLFVDYGQPAHREERVAAAAVARHYGVGHAELAVGGLCIGVGEIPARNALLITLALAALPRAGTVGLGIHAGSPYWDCSEDFVAAMQRVADGYSGGAAQIAVPFIGLGKHDVCALGRSLGVPQSLTYSCELGGGPCRTCASCLDQVAHART